MLYNILKIQLQLTNKKWHVYAISVNQIMNSAGTF